MITYELDGGPISKALKLLSVMTSQGRRQDINNDGINVWEKEVMRRRPGQEEVGDHWQDKGGSVWVYMCVWLISAYSLLASHYHPAPRARQRCVSDSFAILLPDCKPFARKDVSSHISKYYKIKCPQKNKNIFAQVKIKDCNLMKGSFEFWKIVSMSSVRWEDWYHSHVMKVVLAEMINFAYHEDQWKTVEDIAKQVAK